MDCAELVGECPFQPLFKTERSTVDSLRLVILKGDNQAALTLVKDAYIHNRLKYINEIYKKVKITKVIKKFIYNYLIYYF